MSRTGMGRLTGIFFATLALGLGACSKGGSEDNPSAGVKLAAEYNLVGLEALSTLAFPLPPGQASAYDESMVALEDNGRFAMTIAKSQISGPYNLRQDGIISLLVPQSGNSSITLMGGVDREGEAFWFTDRMAGTTNPISFWAAVRTKADAKLRGKWNVALLTLLHAPNSAAKDPDNIALASAGTLEVDSAGKVTGNLEESSGAKLAVTGTVGDFKLGELDLTLEWTVNATKTTIPLNGAVGDNLMVAAFRNGQIGGGQVLMIGVKAPATALKAEDLDGNYHIATFTCFADPDNPATDVAAGTLELNGKDAFSARMYGVYSQNGFTFRGGFTLGTAGLVDFDETSPVTIPLWGAATEGGGVLVLLDRTKERTDPDLSIFMAIREWVDPNQ